MLKTLRRGWIVYYPHGVHIAPWVRDHNGTGFYLLKRAPKNIQFTASMERATAYPSMEIAHIEGRHMGMGDMQISYVDLDKAG